MQRQEIEEEEEEPIQAKLVSSAYPLIQKQEEVEEEPLMTKGISGRTQIGDDLHTRLNKGSGSQPLPETDRSFMERKFGSDFSGVRVHTDSDAVKMSSELNAQAFTHGRDIYFGAGRYSPSTSSGKRLLAHELTHVVQQTGATAQVQRQWIPDTGWRYKPPANVTRAIVEIQAIVGTKPDGIYGPNTREFVKKYQTKLKSLGLYTKTIDGKWGTNTEAAHVAFATGPNFLRRGYNCAGFAFKTYQFHSMAETKGKFSSMTNPSNCSKVCKAYYHKFFYWEFDINVTDTTTSVTSPTWRDFHTVGGQTDKKGQGPNQVMSKDGQRPVVGPKPPLQWRPVTEPVIDNDGNTVPNLRWNVSNVNQECYCSKKLP